MGWAVCLNAPNYGIGVRLIAPHISPVQHSRCTGHSVCLWSLANTPLFLHLSRLHAQLVADELEGGGDGLVHVVVLVAAQATGEDHVALLCC